MGTSSFKPNEYRLPIVIQQFHTNLGDDVTMLVLFDLLQLISKLNWSIKNFIDCSVNLLYIYIWLLGQIIVFDLEKQHAQKTSNTWYN